MDLNRLFFLHQVALIRASESDNLVLRDRFNAEADDLASSITEIQDRDGADCAPLLPAAEF